MFLKRVCGVLDENKLPYAIVGGYAVALHGAVRGTLDIDLIIEQKKSAFLKLEKSMKDLGLHSRLPVTAADVFDFREEYINNRNLIAWSFYNPKNPSEIVDVIITEDLSKLKKVRKVLGDLKIQVLSIPDLIKMKSKTERPQDIEDIKALRQL